MRSGNGCCPGIVGNMIPNDFELNVRLTHAPEAESEGKSADRAWRTRASASVVRSVASSTGVAWPDATRTASAKERRSGVVVAGSCAPRKEGAAASHARTAPSRRLLLRDAMEIQVDVGVEVLLHVEGLRHARRERAARHRGVYQRRHRELRGDHDVHRAEFAALDAALDHAGYQAVPAGHDFVVVEARQLREGGGCGHHQ